MFLEIEKKPENQIALMDDTLSTFSYGELIKFSKEFFAKIEKRSVVFVMCSNTAGAVAGFYSCIENKAVPLLLNKDMDMHLWERLFRSYQPGYIWAPWEMNFADTYVVWERLGYRLLKTSYESYEVHRELSLLLTTSGSTGSPKLVRHSYKNLDFSYRAAADFFGFRPEDNGMAALPMQYTMGLSVICSHLYAGAKVTLTDYNLMSPEFWRRFTEEEITDFTGVPFSYEVLDRLRFFKSRIPSLRILAEGGGRLSDELYKKIAEYADFHGIQFFATFGTTETTARLAYLNPDMTLKKVGSIGNAIHRGRLFLVDEKGQEIENMEAEGEMGYAGPNVTLGYALSKEDLSKGDERYGVYMTGDIARRDRDGCYFITGRSARFLKLYGLRVSLDQCERLIRDKFHIDCACTGNDEEMRICLLENENGDSVVDYISKKTHLARKCFRVRYFSELPRSNTGKILYSALF